MRHFENGRIDSDRTDSREISPDHELFRTTYIDLEKLKRREHCEGIWHLLKAVENTASIIGQQHDPAKGTTAPWRIRISKAIVQDGHKKWPSGTCSPAKDRHPHVPLVGSVLVIPKVTCGVFLFLRNWADDAELLTTL